MGGGGDGGRAGTPWVEVGEGNGAAVDEDAVVGVVMRAVEVVVVVAELGEEVVVGGGDLLVGFCFGDWGRDASSDDISEASSSDASESEASESMSISLMALLV